LIQSAPQLHPRAIHPAWYLYLSLLTKLLQLFFVIHVVAMESTLSVKAALDGVKIVLVLEIVCLGIWAVRTHVNVKQHHLLCNRLPAMRKAIMRVGRRLDVAHAPFWVLAILLKFVTVERMIAPVRWQSK